jgi:hypothetical protein
MERRGQLSLEPRPVTDSEASRARRGESSARVMSRAPHSRRGNVQTGGLLSYSPRPLRNFHRVGGFTSTAIARQPGRQFLRAADGIGARRRYPPRVDGARHRNRHRVLDPATRRPCLPMSAGHRSFARPAGARRDVAPSSAVHAPSTIRISRSTPSPSAASAS